MRFRQATHGRRDLAEHDAIQGLSIIVLVMILLDGIANRIGFVDHFAVFVCLGFFLFFMTFVLFFTHDGGSFVQSLESLAGAFS